MKNVINIGIEKQKSISEKLIEMGVVSSTMSGNATELFYMRWIKGNEHFNKYEEKKKSQYYVHKKRLKTIGIDIDQKIITGEIKAKIKELEEIKDMALNIKNEEKRKMVWHTAEYLKKLINEL
ncbi:phage/plasmid replication domain-containing protein [Rheinheimera faecalis]